MKFFVVTLFIFWSLNCQSQSDTLYLKGNDLLEALNKNPMAVKKAFSNKPIFLEGYIDGFSIWNNILAIKGHDGKLSINCRNVSFKKSDSLEYYVLKAKTGQIKIILFGICQISEIGSENSYSGSVISLNESKVIGYKYEPAKIFNDSISTKYIIKNELHKDLINTTITSPDLFKKYSSISAYSGLNLMTYVSGSIMDIKRNYRNSSKTAIVLETRERNKFVRCLDLNETDQFEIGKNVTILGVCCTVYLDYNANNEEIKYLQLFNSEKALNYNK